MNTNPNGLFVRQDLITLRDSADTNAEEKAGLIISWLVVHICTVSCSEMSIYDTLSLISSQHLTTLGHRRRRFLISARHTNNQPRSLHQSTRNSRPSHRMSG